MHKIILVGYMAVGKTTIARSLAEKINFEVVDLDKMIECEVGLSIPEIFERKGELYFRKMEHELFRNTIESEQKLIISTGGGTPCYANNHLLLAKKNVVSIYLKASLGTILERISSGNNNRPLTANKTLEELQEFVAKHLFERSFYYNHATFTLSVDHKSVDEITQEIIGVLH